ncbi:MAG: hypothetical protein WCD38_09975 [Candidatus Tumulicola sp.]
MRHSRQWIAPEILISLTLALSACAGGGTSPTPSGPGLSGAPAAQHAGRPRLTIAGVRTDNTPTCNASEFPGGCFTFSIHNGLDVHWCYGSPSDPCGQTGDITNWSGGVCKAKSSCATALHSFKVTWTGPIACGPSQCSGGGSYEDDSIVKGRTPPNKSTGYAYKQIISGCFVSASCGVLTTIGIRVLK